MRESPTKEMQDPNKGPVSALKRRPISVGEATASPAKQQRKKTKVDRRTRRVSFAPDPELTMVHHFEKDDSSALSDGGPVLSTLDEQEDPFFTEEIGYQPGFFGKTVPENSPTSDTLPLDGSPSMVSMELTEPTLAEAGAQNDTGHKIRGWGGDGVTDAIPSMNALLREDEEEEEDLAGQQENRVQATAAETVKPSPGIKSVARVVPQSSTEMQQEQPIQRHWGSHDETSNGMTFNITGAIPGLSSLLAEDEDGDGDNEAEVKDELTSGMDLTAPTGRVLEHAEQLPASEQNEQIFNYAQSGQPQHGEEPQQEADGAAPIATVRRSSAGELTPKRAIQASKWGFAPGCEDTLDINLEMHGRMFMGDNTFNKMYADNTTRETTSSKPAAPLPAGEDGSDCGMDQDSPQKSDGAYSDEKDVLLSPESPSLQQQQGQDEVGQGTEANKQAPNWQAPAFLPPYAQKSQTITSDHPALVHSPADTNSTMNTLETRRISVGDTRRHSTATDRRISLADATGRLLQDDFEEDLGLDLQPAPQPMGSRRRSSIGKALGRDITENLLADEEEGDNPMNTGGHLAGLKRQLRMLHQEPQEDPEVGAAEQLVVKAPHTTPCQARSMGMADSSNPGTQALLRSGGTTRLLNETVHVKAAGKAKTAATAAQPARSAGNGTTKLLADMTMASVVGMKLQRLGEDGPSQRLSEDGEQGLTDYSLDGFDKPPELPEAPHQQQQELQAEHDMLAQPAQSGRVQQAMSPHSQQPQHGGTPLPANASQGRSADNQEPHMIPGGPKLARTPVTARTSASQRTHGTPRSVRSMPQHSTPLSRRQDTTPASAARPATSAATYPLPQDDTIDCIPGGPKLHRTPVRGGRASHVQFVQGQPGAAHTPLTARLPSVPGVPGSAMAQHYPGTSQRAPTSAMLARYHGSAMAPHRLAGRGMTPMQQVPSQPLPMTFQDFTKLMDVQFLDNLRRGASINYADMQRNAVPKNVQESYTLLCAISPQVMVLENGIRILQELVQERRIKSAESETFIGVHNPSLFGDVQYVDEQRLEELKDSVGLLKKLLRQKAVAELKAYRKEMEEDKAHRLMRNLELLQQDRAFLESNEQSMAELAKAVQQYVAEQQRVMEDEVKAHQAEAERRKSILALKNELEEQQQGSAQRQQQMVEVQERVAVLQAQKSTLEREREAIQSKIKSLEQRLSHTKGGKSRTKDIHPHALLAQSKQLQVLTACMGWRLEKLQQSSESAELDIRLAELFLLHLHIGGGSASGSVQLAPGSAAQLPADRQQLAADMAAVNGLTTFKLELGGGGLPKLSRSLQYVLRCTPKRCARMVNRLPNLSTWHLPPRAQAASLKLNRIAQLLAELEGLQLSCPCLTHLTYCQGTLQLGFVHLSTEVQFSVDLSLPGSYPMGDLPHELEIRSSGGGHVTAASVAETLAGVPQGKGRIRAVCAALSSLAGSAAPAQPYFLRPLSPDSLETAPAVLQDADFQNYSNPLYGASASCSMAS